jgi:hypothetical protein
MSRESGNQTTILTHAVMVGLTPLIPVPFLDDAVKTYLQRRLVRSIGSTRGVSLDDETVKALADDPSGGCLLGCLGTVVFYPIKKIFRKIFFLLEWKRAVDLVSLTYHRAILLDHAIAEGWLARGPANVRAAVDEVVRETPTRPVEEAVRTTFRQSKSALKGAAAILQRAVSGLRREATPDEVGAAIEPVRDEEVHQVEGVVSSLGDRINAIPKEHFDGMRRRLAERLG